MTKHPSIIKMTFSLFWVIAGNFLYALAVKLFLLPGKLVTGGTTGIALIVNQISGLPISAFVLVFNVAMLLLGFFLIGKAFAVTTVVSTFTYPLALELFNRVFSDTILTSDTLLCTVFSGLGIGAALGLVIRAGASTGGMDIPPLILNRYFRIPVSVGIYAFDFVILLSQAFYQPAEKLLYGILLVLIYTIVLDKLMLMGTTKTEVKIVSARSDQIRSAILLEADRGVTMLSGTSGYLHEDTQVLLSVISNRELPKIEKIIHSVDPECFMVVTRVSEVRGHGFTLKKQYR